MKKIILSTMLLASIGVIYTGCKKDSNSPVANPDTTAPVITLKGGNPTYVVAIDSNFTLTDPGATAIDNINGDISSDINVDYSSYLRNTAGTYNIRYNVSDSAGNDAIEVTRVIYNTYTGAKVSGAYSAVDTVYQAGNPTPDIQSTYNQTLSLSATDTWKVFTNNFYNNIFSGNFVNFTMQGSQITIPTQTPNGAGSADVLSGSGTVTRNSVNGAFTFDLHWTQTNSGPTLSGHSIIVTQ